MNYHRAFLFFAGIACAASFAGCKGTTTSDLVDTGDVFAVIDVYEDGGGSVEISASLEAHTNNEETHLKLVGADKLTATYGDQAAPMKEVGTGEYSSTFSLSDAADVRVQLDRTKFRDARTSIGVMPESVELPSFGGGIISRNADDIVIQLPETIGYKTIDLEGACIQDQHRDLGSAAVDVTIYAGELHGDTESECDVTMTVTTETWGEPDPALQGDSIFTLRRSRSTSFYSVP